MKKFQIRFGCFDFIVDNDNNYVFLEVNEMGQFLWIERDNPAIRVLSTFCQFIEKAVYSEAFYPIEDEVKLENYMNDDVEKILNKEQQIHNYRYKEERYN